MLSFPRIVKFNTVICLNSIKEFNVPKFYSLINVILLSLSPWVKYVPSLFVSILANES